MTRLAPLESIHNSSSYNSKHDWSVHKLTAPCQLESNDHTHGEGGRGGEAKFNADSSELLCRPKHLDTNLY